MANRKRFATMEEAFNYCRQADRTVDVFVSETRSGRAVRTLETHKVIKRGPSETTTK